jgi:aryl sulfotransferase
MSQDVRRLSPAQGGLFGWLVSYPKSGNTWMRIMLTSLRQGGVPIDIAEPIDSHILNRGEFEEHFGVESSDLTQAEMDAARPELHRAIARASKDPLILRKVHDRCWFTSSGERAFPPEVSRGAVYIVRDPRDVAVSLAHFYGMDLEAAVGLMGDSARTIARSSFRLTFQLSQPLGSWSEHVAGWLDDAAMPLLPIRYEDMLADSARELEKVARFLGLPLEACAQAAAASTFSTLRGQEDQRGFRERMPATKRFFRQGRSGEGKEKLPTPLLERIEAEHGAVMARLGYV